MIKQAAPIMRMHAHFVKYDKYHIILYIYYIIHFSCCIDVSEVRTELRDKIVVIFLKNNYSFSYLLKAFK